MKFKFKQAKHFKPVEVWFTLESEEDCKAFLTLLNQSQSALRQHAKDTLDYDLYAQAFDFVHPVFQRVEAQLNFNKQ
jgi:hypothetical protein